jgi:actin related protein 2/3 complex subunit 1A/1B
MPVQTIKTSFLPFVTLFWASETSLVAAGFDLAPYLISNNGKWYFQLIRAISGKIDTKNDHSKDTQKNNAAFNMFKQMDSFAQESKSSNLPTVHQNTITCLRPYDISARGVQKFSSSGLDGQIVVWDLLSASVANMKM